MSVKKLAKKILKQAYKKGVTEMEQYKMLAAYNILIGNFEAANQYQFQINMISDQ